MSNPCRALFVFIVVSVLGAPAGAQWMSQEFHLKAGWNAVFLEVTPHPAECDLQFQGLPIRSVWTHDPRFSAVEFIQDPGELTPDLPEWQFYAPPASPYSFATNLFILQAGTAYLIDATEAATWNVVGQPVLTRQTWNPDGYNLDGVCDNPASPCHEVQGFLVFEGFGSGRAASTGRDPHPVGHRRWRSVGL